MTLRVKENNVFTEVGGGAVVQQQWIRPAAWPALTAPSAAEQRIVGLHAVWPGDGVGNGGNFFAFLGRGAYTINFGDGTTTDYADNVQANYEYNFNNSALDGTNCPVTFTAATSTVNRTAHGLSNGSIIQFYGIVTTTGVLLNANYYVINATVNTFQVALTANGSAVAMTNNGSATLLPYKVAIVTITPQAGQNLTLVNLSVKHNQTGLQAYGTGWLDLALSVPNVTGAGLLISSTLTLHVERINIVAVGALTSLANLFRNCRNLRSIPSLPSATGVTSMAEMFVNCNSLQTIPPFPGSVAAVTSMASMFNGCASLQTIPPFPGSVAAVTSMANMFNGCASLQTIPPFPGSVAAVTTMFNMFNGCASLQTIPPFPGSVAAVTSMLGMFQSCASLQTIPPFPGSVAAVTTMFNMFQGCSSLQTIPAFPGSVAAVTTMLGMFQSCSSLQTIPAFPGSVAAVTTMANMFQSCSSLQTIPAFPGSVAAVTTMANMFSGCSSLLAVPAMNLTGMTSASSLTNFIINCPSLARAPVTEARFSFSVANCKLSAAALNEIFTGLPTVTGQTITVTGNYGINQAGYDPTIATAKGWTVTA
jgi:hypothetical protein